MEQCQAIGIAGDLILMDPSTYLIGDKANVGIQSAVSIHVRFVYDESVFRFVYRCDGQTEYASAITPFKGVLRFEIKSFSFLPVDLSRIPGS